MNKNKIDKIFLTLAGALTFIGFMVFISSSMSLAAREGINLYRFVASQFILGILGGSIIAFIIAISRNLNWLKKYSLWIFIGSLILGALVFSPLGFGYNGARRWLIIGPINLQPAEFIKLGYIIFFAAYLSKFKDRLHDFKFGLIPYFAITGVAVGLLALHPDMDGAITIAACSFVMFLVAGAKWRDIAIIIITGVLAFGAMFIYKPYIISRVTTFLHPEKDLLGSGYQIQQSLIAIGSGGVWGKGFGQSLQKFKFLPESNSDAIFPVAAEEFGFVGCILIIGLFIAFAFRGLRIAIKSPDFFGGLMVVGIVILILTQSFMNIGSMIAVMPLAGLPLAFFSKGGTSLFFILIGIGIILNVSKNKKLIKT